MLSGRVILARRSEKVSIGHGGNISLERCRGYRSGQRVKTARVRLSDGRYAAGHVHLILQHRRPLRDGHVDNRHGDRMKPNLSGIVAAETFRE